MRPDKQAARRRFLRGVPVAILAVTLAGCGGQPVPAPTATPTSPEPTDTPATPPTATPAPVIAPKEPTPTPEATATPLPAVQAATPEPAQEGWLVRSLMVGPGRTYVLLNSGLAQEEADQPRQVLLYSDDEGLTWAEFPGGLPPVPWVSSVNLDYASLDSLYAGAGAADDGLYHWTGSEWSLISEVKVAKVEVVYMQPQIIWAVHPTVGGQNEPMISRSDDGGRTWTKADTGIDRWGVSYLNIDPRDSNTLYALGPWLYRGTAEGLWRPIPTDEWFPAAFSGMALEGGNGAVYVSLSGPNQVWRSTNANAADIATIEWQLVHDFGDDFAVQLLATGPSESGLALYANLAAIGDRDGDFLPYRSPDGGATWERIVIPGRID